MSSSSEALCQETDGAQWLDARRLEPQPIRTKKERKKKAKVLERRSSSAPLQHPSSNAALTCADSFVKLIPPPPVVHNGPYNDTNDNYSFITLFFADYSWQSEGFHNERATLALPFCLLQPCESIRSEGEMKKAAVAIKKKKKKGLNGNLLLTSCS